MNEPTFGEWLDAELRHQRVSQSELARRAGTSRQTVHRWIKEGDTPDGDNIAAIARALNVEPGDILSRLEPTTQRRPHTVTPIMVPVRASAAADPAEAFGGDAGRLTHVAWIPDRVVSDQERRAMFAVIVDGDCLAPEVVPGEYAIVDPSAPKTFGKYAVISIDGMYHVKRLEARNGQPVLTSNHGDLATDGAIQFEGMVVGWYRPG
jgi:phage repressor protein C with HTH and peptisase S24 domain